MRYNPSDYFIAVLGYPKSGKSIFITSFIDYLIHKKISGYKTIKIENETAKRLKKDIKCLNSHIPFDQTGTESVFPYIVDISKGKPPLKKYFKVQLGDFSGDDSAQFSEGYRQ